MTCPKLFVTDITPMLPKILKIIAPVLGIVLGWIVVVPIFEFPDEQVHLSTVNYFATHGSVQPYDTPDVTAEMYRTQELFGTLRDGMGNNKYTYHPNYHVEYSSSLTGLYEPEILSLNNPASRSAYVKDEGAQYPPLYYAYSSLWLKLVAAADLLTRTLVVRFGGLPLAGLMAYFVYQIGIITFGKKSYANTLVALTFLQPMFVFVTAGINSDNLHNTLFFALVYYSLVLLARGISFKPLLMATLVIILDIYTKPQGFIGIPILGIALFLSAFQHKQWKLLLSPLGIGLIVGIFAYPQLSRYLSFAFLDNARGISLIEYLRFSLNKLVAQNIVWYWGVFKWLGVVLPPIYWRLANRLVLVSVFGFVVYLWRMFNKKKVVASPLVTTFLLLVTLIYTASIFWADYQHHKNVGYSLGIQARYFFPTLVAQLALLQTGILSLGWSLRLRTLLRRGLILFFLWLQIGGFWHLLSIYYDTNNISTLITQLSQYKPLFAKGSWWYLWGTVYITSLITLVWFSWRSPRSIGKVK